MPLRRTDIPAEAFDVAVGSAEDDPEVLVAALEKAGVRARIVLHEGDDPVVKVRHEDLPRIQEAIERQRR